MHLFFRLTCVPKRNQFSSVEYLSNTKAQVSVLYRALCTLYVSKPKQNRCCDVKIIIIFFKTKEFYIMSDSSKYNFSNFKRVLKFNYVVYFQNSYMTTCDHLNLLFNINKMFLTFLPL